MTTPEQLEQSKSALEQSIEGLGETAFRIAEHLEASRALNVEWAKALQDIAALPCSNCEAKVIAARALNGGGE